MIYIINQLHRQNSLIVQFPFLKKMILNLNKPCTQNKPLQNNFFNNADFKKNNKITVNEIVQTHFSVQGVQSYTQKQLAALKQKQQKLYEQKQGDFIKPQIYVIDRELDQFQQDDDIGKSNAFKKKGINMKKFDKKGQKQTKEKGVSQKNETIKYSKPKVSAKQRLQNNNNVLVRLERQRAKKTAIQTKLQKLSKKYKDYFNSEKVPTTDKKEQENKDGEKNSLCESLLSLSKNKEISQGSNQFQVQQELGDQCLPKNMQKKDCYDVTTKAQTRKDKKDRKKNKGRDKQKESQDINNSDSSFEEVELIEQGLNLCGELLTNKSTYSEKLGTAVHLLFK